MSQDKSCKATLVDLNVGGVLYTSTYSTLTEKYPESKLAKLIKNSTSEEQTEIPISFDSQNRIFIDRDGASFRFILDYLRRTAEDIMGVSSQTSGRNWVTKLIPVATDRYRLHQEAEFYGLESLSSELRRCEQTTRPLKPIRANSKNEITELVPTESNITLKPQLKKTISLPQSLKRQEVIFDRSNRTVKSRERGSTKGSHYITIGYRSSYDTSRDMPNNDITRFRRINRITVAGRSDVAMEVFQEDLNDSRDPDRSPEGYTCRYYLKHNYLELAFDTLAQAGFVMLNTYMLAAANNNVNNNPSHTYTQCEAVFFKPV